MKETLVKIISTNSNGLFLLDAPTGFGKTTAVLEVIKDFLSGNAAYKKVKRIFFVTNLKNNLPYKELLDQLSEEERHQCFQAKANIDYVLERLGKTRIENTEVINSKQYKKLQKEIESYNLLRNSLEDINGEKNIGIYNSLKILKQKIETDTEPAFRRFIRSRFFYNKSISDRKKFIEDNEWFLNLYPICNLEKYKVVFLTTQKFISPIDTFRRLPFFAYSDEITKNSLVFIDEFDSTKPTVLNQIIEHSLKNQIDIVGLFLDLYYALQNVSLPRKLLNTTQYNQEKVEKGEWHTTKQQFEYWSKAFKEKYDEHHINYLIKSVDFQYDKAFLFDDGIYFNVVKDSSKKFIYANVSPQDNILGLYGSDIKLDMKQINTIIRDLEYCIDGFAQSLFYVYNNYLYYKNDGKSHYETQYTKEEAIYTVLDVLNLSESQKDYLFKKILIGDYITNKPQQEESIRRGFNYSVIEDSNYHDMKSIVRSYNFYTTPEDIIIKLCSNALVIGISATASVKTCIGNYDINYLRKKLDDKFLDIIDEDQNRIAVDFASMINRLKGKYEIHPKIVDDFNVFSDKEKCVIFINNLYNSEKRNRYLQILDNSGTKCYYFLIELKLVWLYKEMCEKNIQSFIAFVNRFPRSHDDFDLDRLMGMIKDLCEQNNYEPVCFEVVKSDEFEYKFRNINVQLAKGKQVFVLTTYQTIGTGKNIQYSIPGNMRDRVVLDETDIKDMRDFEGVYLATPTNLIQILSFDSEDKYSDLSRYLFHQEYLYQNKHLSYSQMKYNIINGFKKIFFGGDYAFSKKNGDLYVHTLKLAIQAVGRICRCRNKNKNIYIYADKELVDRIQTACNKEQPKLLNEEFRSLLYLQPSGSLVSDKVSMYSQQSKQAYWTILKAAYTVRNSRKAVLDWQELRDFVLRNPTTENPGKYQSLYFEFDDKHTGYSYKQNSAYDIVEMQIDTRYDMQQVSEQACELPSMLSINSVENLFDEQKYASSFKPARFIMSPSLFKQVYLGALGEVVGKQILERELGLNLQELDDVSFYEYFDYKIGNVYFDFKHWDEYITDNDEYVKKIENKLAKIKGSKCFVVNILKRNDLLPKINIDETVIQIPYLIDGDNSLINDDAIKYICEILSY